MEAMQKIKYLDLTGGRNSWKQT